MRNHDRLLPVLLAVLWSAPQAAAVPAPAAVAAVTVGQVHLHRCDTPAPWCGELVRALDPGGAVTGTVAVYFEYYPHSATGPAAGTLVATEGGPGYPATESRDGYLALFEPLRASYDVLIMDNRGTGRSAAVNCRQLQNAPQLTEANIGACGRALGRTAPLYGTALATDDLAAVLDALGIERIGLYGNSYGTYFAQVFALRHAAKLRALVLDGADALDGPDFAWWPHYAPAMRAKFNLACERAPGCKAIAGSSMEHIAPALQLLRAKPLAAHVHYGNRRVMNFTANATQLAIVMFAGSPAYATVRELDAAARAFSAADPVPLLRLMAETRASVDSRDPTHSPAKFSAGLAAAVSCQDPPQIFDMRLAPAQRIAARDLLIAKRTREAAGHLCAVHDRGIPRHASRLCIHRCVRAVAGCRARLARFAAGVRRLGVSGRSGIGAIRRVRQHDQRGGWGRGCGPFPARSPRRHCQQFSRQRAASRTQ